MRPYEVMVIFDADLEEEAIRSAVDRSRSLLESKGAELGYVDFWGKRRFAYRMKHRWEGYYVVFQAKAEPAAMDELHRTLFETSVDGAHQALVDVRACVRCFFELKRRQVL